MDMNADLPQWVAENDEFLSAGESFGQFSSTTEPQDLLDSVLDPRLASAGLPSYPEINDDSLFVPETMPLFDPDLAVEGADSLFKNLKALRDHVFRTEVLAAQLLHAIDIVNTRIITMKAEIDQLWEDNDHLRRRGLRGGTARKNRSQHGSYVPYKDDKANHGKDFLKKRAQVENTDLLGRNRIAGLKALEELFTDNFNKIMNHMGECTDFLDRAFEWEQPDKDLDFYIEFSETLDKLMGKERVDEIDMSEGMLEAFAVEFNFSA